LAVVEPELVMVDLQVEMVLHLPLVRI